MKKICAILLCLCFALSFTACAPKIQKGDTSGDYEINLDVDPDITATLDVLVPDSDGRLESDLIDALAAGFKEKFPNVTIRKRPDQISDEMYGQTIGSLQQAGQLPDLVYTNTALYYLLVDKKAVVNLEPYFATLNMGDYYEEYFNMGMYEGKRYIVPRNVDTVVTYYNTEMLEAAGIKTSGPNKDARLNNDWTWDDFVSVNEDLVAFWDTDRKDKYTYNYGMRQTVFDWESVWNPIMLSCGAHAFTDGKVSIDSQQTRDFVEMYKKLTADKIVPAWDSGSNSRFEQGTAAFEFMSVGPATVNKMALVKGKFDVLPFPLIGENPAVGTGFAGWGISASSAKRDLAWKFLEYMISEEGQMAMIASGVNGTPSVRRSINEEGSWARGFEGLNLEAFTQHAEYKVTPGYFKGFDSSKMLDIQYALQQFTRNCLSSMSTTDCISTAVSALNTAID